MKEKLESLGLSVFKVTLTSVLALIGLLSMIYVAIVSQTKASLKFCVTPSPFKCIFPIIYGHLFTSIYCT